MLKNLHLQGLPHLIMTLTALVFCQLLDDKQWDHKEQQQNLWAKRTVTCMLDS